MVVYVPSIKYIIIKLFNYIAGYVAYVLIKNGGCMCSIKIWKIRNKYPIPSFLWVSSFLYLPKKRPFIDSSQEDQCQFNNRKLVELTNWLKKKLEKFLEFYHERKIIYIVINEKTNKMAQLSILVKNFWRYSYL